ncbi:MAG: hypothetical protein H6806_05645 [Planctomycetes bacterium]|nr:hypothetical protein [Planctomycetota bacterium]MCB9826019.1 hypothetical protein [Planctomycetota bacterium]MCB9829225.1 hypothetical protein [Planctomycetota bacterium]
MNDEQRPPAPVAHRRGLRSRIPYALHLAPWLGATLRVFVRRSWILLPVAVAPLVLLPTTYQLFTPILLLPLPFGSEAGGAWLYAALGLVPPSLVVTLAAVLAPAALRRERWPSSEAWQQAILRFPLVYVAVLGLGVLTSLPTVLLTVTDSGAFLMWMLLVVGLVIQVRCSLAPVILVTRRTFLATSFRASMRLTRHNTVLMLGGYFLLGTLAALALGVSARWLRGPVFWGSRAHEVPVIFAVIQGALLSLYAVAAAVAWNDLDAPHREQDSKAMAEIFD